MSGTQIGCPSRKLITDIVKPPAVHNDDAGHRLLAIVLPFQTLAATPTRDSGLFIRGCRVDPHVRASAESGMVPVEIGKALLGHKNSYITTPELEDLFQAANRVRGEKFGKAPAPVALKQRAVSSEFDNCLIVIENIGAPGESRTPDRLAADYWTEDERGAFATWLSGNPKAGDVIPA